MSDDTIYSPISNGMMSYQEMHAKSINQPDVFWAEQARKYLSWFCDFDRVQHGSFEEGDIAWFLNGKLNASVCCIDQHLPQRADQVAIIWEGDEPGNSRHITYAELLKETCRIANAMKASGIKRGDVVTIYMPMIPEIAFTMLACARIGAPHSVVFAGFSSDSLKERIIDGSSKWVFTTDQGKRGGRTLELKQIVDAAVNEAPCVEKVFVFERTGAEVPFNPDRDILMKDLLSTQRPYCPAEVMDSEDLLFILYTSGSTGRPKGLAHTTAGYLVYTALTTKVTFDLREGDVYACVADCGWITGHSYIVYGPLVNGATTLMFESTPLYPDPGRYWDLVQRYRVTQFYTAPTAVRALMRFDLSYVKKYDLRSLRVIGSVGEPINPEAWRWYYDNVGGSRCTLVDTWWQTETGGHIATSIPGGTPMKAGSCGAPFFGMELVMLDKDGKEIKIPPIGTAAASTGQQGSDGSAGADSADVVGFAAIKKPWPSLARTVYNNHERYLNVYFRPYPGYYFTGDGCRLDKDGFFFITGRVDDVLNTSGHRIGTAEIESALVAHSAVSEAAVVGFPHDVKGEAIGCYCILVENALDGGDGDGALTEASLIVELRNAVRQTIGAFATPDAILLVPGLPKTRSGKIMRRILRKILSGEEDSLGDTSTLADPDIVTLLVDKVQNYMKNAKKK